MLDALRHVHVTAIDVKCARGGCASVELPLKNNHTIMSINRTCMQLSVCSAPAFRRWWVVPLDWFPGRAPIASDRQYQLASYNVCCLANKRTKFGPAVPACRAVGWLVAYFPYLHFESSMSQYLYICTCGPNACACTSYKHVGHIRQVFTQSIFKHWHSANGRRSEAHKRTAGWNQREGYHHQRRRRRRRRQAIKVKQSRTLKRKENGSDEKNILLKEHN